MPAKSQQQLKFIYALRNKYKTKKEAPKKFKWVFDEEWTDGVKMKKLPEVSVKENIITRFENFLNEAVITPVDFTEEVNRMSDLGNETSLETINDIFDKVIFVDRQEFIDSLPDGIEKDNVPPIQQNPIGMGFAAYNYHNDTIYIIVEPRKFIPFVRNKYAFGGFKSKLNSIIGHESIHREQKSRRGEIKMTNLEIDPTKGMDSYLSNKDEIMAYAETFVSDMRNQGLSDGEIIDGLKSGEIRDRMYNDYKNIGGETFKRFVKYIYMYLTVENEDK